MKESNVLKGLPEEAIEVRQEDLVKLVQEAYALSRPQGMGHVHYRSGGLDTPEAMKIVGVGRHDDLFPEDVDRINKTCHGVYDIPVLSLDYVHGRAVKLTVWKTPGGQTLCKGAVA
jgi:hypothetical protein